MSQIAVVIQDHTYSKKTLVELPDNVHMRCLLPALAAKMNLPLTMKDDRAIHYRLDHRRSGVRIADEETLADVGVQPHDILTLLPEVTAGGPGPLPRSENVEEASRPESHLVRYVTGIAAALALPVILINIFLGTIARPAVAVPLSLASFLIASIVILLYISFARERIKVGFYANSTATNKYFPLLHRYSKSVRIVSLSAAAAMAVIACMLVTYALLKNKEDRERLQAAPSMTPSMNDLRTR